MAKKLLETGLTIFFLKEGDTFICYSPALDLVAHGDSFTDAEKSFEQTLKLFIREVSRKGTWEQVLQECGWEKVNKEWAPPRVIGQETMSVQLPVSA